MSTKQIMKAFNREVPPSPKVAWPVVTFTRDISFHLNGDTFNVFHVENAHTDGDAMVHFVNANVIHMGDVYFNGFYPFIDTGSGGSILGTIAAVERVLAMPEINDNTKIIPGHGPLSNKAELIKYHAMLKGVEKSVSDLVAAGKSLEEALAAKPTTAFDEVWGGGFMKPERFTEIVFNDLNQK